MLPNFLLATLCSLLPAFLLTWRTSFLARGANTHPLLSLVCYQLPTLCCFSHPNTPYRSSYNIYVDDINNISRPRLTHSHIPTIPSHLRNTHLQYLGPSVNCMSYMYHTYPARRHTTDTLRYFFGDDVALIYELIIDDLLTIAAAMKCWGGGAPAPARPAAAPRPTAPPEGVIKE